MPIFFFLTWYTIGVMVSTSNVIDRGFDAWSVSNG
jgi:hypothetical protein